MRLKKDYVWFTAVICGVLVLIIGCSMPSEEVKTSSIGNNDGGTVVDHDGPSVSGSIQSYQITESGPVMLDNLAANQVFAVAANKAADFVSYSASGEVVSYTLNGIKHQIASTGRSAATRLLNSSDRETSFTEQGDKIPIQYGRREAGEFNESPPPIPPVNKVNKSARNENWSSQKIGDKRSFWLDDFDSTYTWQEKQATLAAISNHAEVWVLDEYFNAGTTNVKNQLTNNQAGVIAEKFDAIYHYTTPVFGYEYGGHNSVQDGGVDGNPRIIILLYDIDANNPLSGTIGYFWSKDHYTNDYLQSYGSSYKSNHSEMFYIDSYWANTNPETVYSALVHEFVHMINFNEKFVKYGKTYGTWYTEMLAMLGEDIISPLIGIGPDNPGHPVKTRVPYTLGLYSYDPTFWSGSMSYGVTYGFGAYLARNYGGIALISEIAKNDKTNIDSVTLALSAVNPAMNFTKAVEQYHQAFICNDTSDSGAASFNRTVTDTINGYQYTLYGFDIYKINRVNVAIGVGTVTYWNTSEKGPFLYSLNQNYLLDYYSFVLLSCADWRNVSGDLEVEMKKPVSSYVNMYLIVK